jgi:transcriptional regulator with XRE-family HTH domain
MSKEAVAGTANALEIIRRRLIKGDKKREERIRRYEEAFEAAQKIYDLRVARGFSQKELADLVGTTASVICRLEDADYRGHTMNMLRRIATALNCRVEVSFQEEEGNLPKTRGCGKRTSGKKRHRLETESTHKT